MQLNELTNLVVSQAKARRIAELLQDDAIKTIAIDGLVGSAAAVLASQLPKIAAPYVVVLDDFDQAGYFYNDLLQIAGDAAVLLFPSGYKRDIRYGQPDQPQQILRAEVLNRWHDDSLRWVVTYPEALAERADGISEVQGNTYEITVLQAVKGIGGILG